MQKEQKTDAKRTDDRLSEQERIACAPGIESDVWRVFQMSESGVPSENGK